MKILKKYMNKECIIVYKKNYVIISDSLGYDKNFLVIKDTKRDININKDHVNFINYEHEKGSYKIGYDYPYNTTGKIIDVDSKFIEIEILNTNNNKTFNNIVPIKCILGIKVFNQEMDKDEMPKM